MKKEGSVSFQFYEGSTFWTAGLQKENFLFTVNAWEGIPYDPFIRNEVSATA